MERDELGPALLPAEHPLHALSRGEVARDELERLAEASQRLVAAMKAGVEISAERKCSSARVRGSPTPASSASYDGHQRGPVLGLGVQPAEAAERDRDGADTLGERGLVEHCTAWE